MAEVTRLKVQGAVPVRVGVNAEGTAVSASIAECSVEKLTVVA